MLIGPAAHLTQFSKPILKYHCEVSRIRSLSLGLGAYIPLYNTCFPHPCLESIIRTTNQRHPCARTQGVTTTNERTVQRNPQHTTLQPQTLGITSSGTLTTGHFHGITGQTCIVHTFHIQRKHHNVTTTTNPRPSDAETTTTTLD